MTERVVPHHSIAEANVIGAMLLSSAAREAATVLVLAEDFYSPTNQILFAALRDMHFAGMPCDLLAVAEHLRRADVLEEVGGLAHLERLQNPASINIPRHCQIIVDHAAWRALIVMGNQVAEWGWAMNENPADLIDEAHERLGRIAVSTNAPPKDLRMLGEYIDDPAIPASEWVVPGLLRVGWRVMLVAEEGIGKLLRIDERIATPSGWTTMGALKVGDQVYDIHGRICFVLAVSEVVLNPDAYAVEFSDGVVIEADAGHQWLTVDYKERQTTSGGQHRLATRTTAEIRESLRARGGHCANHAVPVAGPLRGSALDLPIPPYTLGAWLGDGTTLAGVVTLNREDAASVEAAIQAEGFTTHHVPSGEKSGSVGVRIDGFTALLREHGFLGFKHIPTQYLRASLEQRRALFAGLMDTDGHVSATGDRRGRGAGATSCELTLTCKPLVDGAVELIRTLGIRTTCKESDAKLNGRVIGPRWRMLFEAAENPFTTPRKAKRWRPLNTRRSLYRYIVDVRPVDPSPMRCISVDSPTHSYLAGDQFVPTHNSVALRQFAILAAAGLHPFGFTPIDPVRVLVVDLENPVDHVRDVSIPIRDAAANLAMEYKPDRIAIWHREGGINIRSRADRAALEACIAHHRPDLVVLGPLYKCYRRDGREGHEEAAEAAQQIFDDLRTRYRFALLLEHHAPKGQHGSRTMDPYGSSLWLRWPELGRTLVADKDGNVNVKRFRRDRMGNNWPSSLARAGLGDSFPWVGRWSDGKAPRPEEPPLDLGP